MLPLVFNSFKIVLNTLSEMVDLYYWFKATYLPPFILCLSKCLKKGSVYA